MTVQQIGVWTRITKSERKSLLRPVRHRAANLAAALLDPREMRIQQPEVLKPRQLIDQVKIIGKDELTASDAALYELMLAWARQEVAVETPPLEVLYDEHYTHEIPLEAVQSFIRVEGRDFIVAGLQRLSETMIRYDIRDERYRVRGTVPLVIAELKENLLTRAAVVSYTIPTHVRRLMINPKSYTFLELQALGRFTSRYSARLYQRLALLAGYDDACRKPLEIEPQKLAEMIGFKWTGPFRYADLSRHCLVPVLADIGKWVKRFGVQLKEILSTATGRGRKTTGLLRFHVKPKLPKVQTLVPAKLNALEIREISKPDEFLPLGLLPTHGIVAKVVQFLGCRRAAVELSAGWRAALDEAIDSLTEGYVPRAGLAATVDDLNCDRLLDAIDNLGVDEAFFAWARQTDATGRFLARVRRIAPPQPVEQKEPMERKSEPSREERRRERAHKGFEELLERLAGKGPNGMPYKLNAIALAAWSDHEVADWPWLEEQLGDNGGFLKQTLVTSFREGEDQCRRTLFNLASAGRTDDLNKVRQIIFAVTGCSMSRGVAAA